MLHARIILDFPPPLHMSSRVGTCLYLLDGCETRRMDQHALLALLGSTHHFYSPDCPPGDDRVKANRLQLTALFEICLHLRSG
jgi:hypothetical protein